MGYRRGRNEVLKRRKGGLKLPTGIVQIGTSEDVGSERGIIAYNENRSVRPLLIPKRAA